MLAAITHVCIQQLSRFSGHFVNYIPVCMQVSAGVCLLYRFAGMGIMITAQTCLTKCLMRLNKALPAGLCHTQSKFDDHVAAGTDLKLIQPQRMLQLRSSVTSGMLKQQQPAGC